MKLLEQRQFAAPESAAAILEERLVIHQRIQPTKSRSLVILIHGLGGTRYGPKNTWGNLPTFIYEDFPRVDLGLYSYRTAFRRFKFWRSIDLEAEARILATLLRELTIYQSIVLVGHSMGGILAKGAAAHLVTSDQKKPLRRLAGLILLASPQLGSLKVPWLLRWLSKDFWVLRPHSKYLTAIDRAFQNHLHLNAVSNRKKRRSLPTWAIVAANDYWVDLLSASIGLPDSQIFHVAGSHTEIVKPPSKTTDSYTYTRSCIEKSTGLKGLKTNRTDEWERLECEAAKLADVPLVWAMARKVFGTGISSEEQMRQWLVVNPKTICVVWRYEARDSTRRRAVAYFCALPLTAAAAERIRSGAITGAQLTAADLVPPDQPTRFVYIGGIAGENPLAKAAAIENLKFYLRSVASVSEATLLTRPVTADGLRLAGKYGLKLASPTEEPMDKLFVGSMKDSTPPISTGDPTDQRSGPTERSGT